MEYEQRENDLFEFEVETKKRKLSNIRFIGELCNKGMIKTNTMHDCLEELLFRNDIDDHCIELVCKMLSTVGAKLSNNEEKRMDQYFRILSDISSRFQPRIRFAIDEIIALRNSGWQERHASDGPGLREDIRQKVANEEQAQRNQSQQPNIKKGNVRNPISSSSNVTGSKTIMSNDARNLGPNSKLGKGPTPVGKSPTIIRSGRTVVDESASGKKRNESQQNSYPMQGSSNDDDIILPSRKSSPSTPASYPEQNSEGATKVQLSDEEARRKTKSIMEEYLTLHDAEEARECINEMPVMCCGFLLENILNRFIESNRHDVHESLLKLVSISVPKFVESSSYIVDAITNYEPFVLLSDTCVDCKQVFVS
jgi:hypothetical protein